ncbi:MAG TPA: sigma-70 family RNA polymerase sigma factor [Phycisphaerae bacterium]|nr:sigma-70 family RNA polymerase sigma factor [Phycisphaerae bacterium]
MQESSMAELREDVTVVLEQMRNGDKNAADKLLPLVYDEFRALARHYLAQERANHTLQPTALVHEAYMKLVDQTRVDWQGRSHFFAVAAQAMRRILVDHARSRQRDKRGGGRARVILDEAVALSPQKDEDVLALDEALERLAALDPRQAKVVELRFFGGLSVEEVAEALGVSKRTVEGDWTFARAWLSRELRDEDGK